MKSAQISIEYASFEIKVIRLLQHTVLGITAEVQHAHRLVARSIEKKALFTEAIVSDAERVRDAVVYSYQRGEATLLEVLDAQRTLNEIYIHYFDALSDYFEAVVHLSEVTGVWFVKVE